AAPPFGEVVDALKRTGQWQPGWLERGIAEFYDAIAQLPPLIRFAEGAVQLQSSMPPAQWFREFLAALPPAVVMDPVAAPPRREAPAHGSTLHFAELAPGGPRIAPDSLQLHRAALALQHADASLSYSAALLRAAR